MPELSLEINLLARMSAVAEALNVGHDDNPWRTEPGHQVNDRDVWLRGPDGEAIHVNREAAYLAAGRTKLNLSGSLTDGKLYDFVPYDRRDAAHKSIGVSITKSARQIAGDIERRLLPGYRELLTVARAEKAKHDASLVVRDELLVEVLAALGDRGRQAPVPTYKSDDHTREVQVGTYGRGLYGKATVTPWGSDVVLELRVPKTLLVEFARVTADLIGKGDVDA